MQLLVGIRDNGAVSSFALACDFQKALPEAGKKKEKACTEVGKPSLKKGRRKDGTPIPRTQKDVPYQLRGKVKRCSGEEGKPAPQKVTIEREWLKARPPFRNNPRVCAGNNWKKAKKRKLQTLSAPNGTIKKVISFPRGRVVPLCWRAVYIYQGSESDKKAKEKLATKPVLLAPLRK